MPEPWRSPESLAKRKIAQRVWAKKNQRRLNVYRRQWAILHPDNVKAAKLRHRQKNKIKFAALDWKYHMKRKYGKQAWAWYHAQFEKQNGACGLCLRPQNELKMRLSIDHNHKTGVLRGLLCSYCNTVVGLVENRGHEILSRIPAWLSETI